ncbi:MAG: hypothetical protein BWX80_03165 [Candidatus Hydrogenedentes bacterium ADurb.Bin101]|jgi:sarcosine oxidase delta subunit|nr:MAG: hypothetical protein BWX80_03165 [Candidatus Hydrogenedentes bacterium ADurb.Bin101]HOC69973.1 hypothetical protein [Candidatus Hydrogenedentota bacterium]
MNAHHFLTGLLWLVTALATGAAEDTLQPWTENPFYWSYRGAPVALLGASDDDNLFQWPEEELLAQLDRLAAAGGNVIRNTMSDRLDKGFEVYPYLRREDGKYDLNAWNEEYWTRFERLLRETAARDIFVQIEVWDRFDYTDSGNSGRWKRHPYNPGNNINYTYQESGFSEHYPEHPGANKQPFFFTTPRQRNNTVVLPYQQRFVEKMLEHTLKYGHLLYCMDNETNGEEEWGRYWAGFIKERAAKAGKAVYVTEMWDDWDLASPMHKRTFDHPEWYDFVDVSQNTHVKGRENWDRLLQVREYLNAAPRPMNTTKIYGADGNKFGDTAQDGIERFWRHLLAGAASVRFHRPDAGLGLSDKATASIQAARKLMSKLPLWTLTPSEALLSECEPNEAYAAASPGHAYAVYFPAGGGRVTLNTPGVKGRFILFWVDVDSGEWGPEQQVESEDTMEMVTPGNGNWAVVMTTRQ